MLFKLFLHLAVVQHLLRLEGCKKLLYIIKCTFASKEFSGRDVEESHATHSLRHKDRSKEVVLLIIKHIVAHSHARSYKLGNATLYESLCKLRVFKLVADGHTFSCTNKLWKISVEGMMWKSCHLGCSPVSVLAIRATC